MESLPATTVRRRPALRFNPEVHDRVVSGAQLALVAMSGLLVVAAALGDGYVLVAFIAMVVLSGLLGVLEAGRNWPVLVAIVVVAAGVTVVVHWPAALGDDDGFGLWVLTIAAGVFLAVLTGGMYAVRQLAGTVPVDALADRSTAGTLAALSLLGLLVAVVVAPAILLPLVVPFVLAGREPHLRRPAMTAGISTCGWVGTLAALTTLGLADDQRFGWAFGAVLVTGLLGLVITGTGHARLVKLTGRPGTRPARAGTTRTSMVIVGVGLVVIVALWALMVVWSHLSM